MINLNVVFVKLAALISHCSIVIADIIMSHIVPQVKDEAKLRVLQLFTVVIVVVVARALSPLRIDLGLLSPGSLVIVVSQFPGYLKGTPFASPQCSSTMKVSMAR